ncbi:hypothetical protein FRC17_001317, partial [Serendipita sp. 399]
TSASSAMTQCASPPVVSSNGQSAEPLLTVRGKETSGLSKRVLHTGQLTQEQQQAKVQYYVDEARGHHTALHAWHIHADHADDDYETEKAKGKNADPEHLKQLKNTKERTDLAYQASLHHYNASGAGAKYHRARLAEMNLTEMIGDSTPTPAQEQQMQGHRDEAARHLKDHDEHMAKANAATKKFGEL